MTDSDARHDAQTNDDAVDGIAQLLGLGLITPAEIADLRPEELECLVTLMEQAQARGAYEELLVLARGLVVLSPFDVRGWRAAAKAFAACGDAGLAQAARERAEALFEAQMPEPTEPAPQKAQAAFASATLAQNIVSEVAVVASEPLLKAPLAAQRAHASEAPQEDLYVTNLRGAAVFELRSGKELPDPERLPHWSTAVTSPALAPFVSDEETTQPYVHLDARGQLAPSRREPTITAVVSRPSKANAATDASKQQQASKTHDSFEYISRPEPMLRETGTTAVVRRRQRLPLIDFLDAALGRDD